MERETHPRKPWLAHYEPGAPAAVEIPAYPVTENLARNAADYPRDTALIFGNVVEPLGNRLLDAKISYARLFEQTQRMAAALQKLGVQPGDRVAIHLPNCPQFVIAYYAALMIGAIVVPCNPQYVARELAHQVRDSGARVLVTLSLTYPLARQVAREVRLEHIVVANIKTYFPPLLKLLFTLARERKDGHYHDLSDAPRAHWMRELMRQAPERPTPARIDMDDTAVLMYTGGTTGTIKGAALTHRNVQANAVQIRAWFPSLHEGEEMILAALPLYHSYGMTTCMNLGIRTRTSILLIVDPRVQIHVLKSIDKHGPSIYPGVPAFYADLTAQPDLERYDLSSIKACISGAAPLPEAVQRRFEKLTGGRLVEGYGLSEASPVTHANPVFGQSRLGTIGLPLPGTEARIVDLETGTRELSPGARGELIVRGPQVMRGYWRQPEETALALRDGWLYTGDIACMDEDGYFRVVDRKKNLILGAGGISIYPSEIEDVVSRHPKVEKCAVVGVPVSAEKGERVKAFVTLRSGERMTDEELIAYCRRYLAGYKVPKFVEFRAHLPHNHIGKIVRRLLREEFEREAIYAEGVRYG